MPWRRKWQPTPVFLPGEFHGQRSLAGYRPWGHKESDMTEWLTYLGFSMYNTMSSANSDSLLLSFWIWMPLFLFQICLLLCRVSYSMCGLPWWLSGKESACQCRRPGFDPWVRKIPWRRKWQPSPSSFAWEIPWTEEPGGYSPRGHRVGHDWSDLARMRAIPKEAVSSLEFFW